VAPFIASFFAGSVVLSRAVAQANPELKLTVYVHLVALGIAIAGGITVPRGIVPGRLVGLLVLGAVSTAQALVGIRCTTLAAGTRCGA
jgi:hypothetical protein